MKRNLFIVIVLIMFMMEEEALCLRPMATRGVVEKSHSQMQTEKEVRATQKERRRTNMPKSETEEISRVIKTKEDTKSSYDRISKWYDMLAGPWERKPRDAALQKLSAKEGETVLEIGFGTGHCILTLAQLVGNSGKVYGIDISEGMYNIALSRVREAGLSERVKLKCGDAAKLPFESNSFDAIFMSFTLELFDTPEIPIVLHECQRVLRNGGRICVLAMSKKGKASMMMRLYEWLHKKFPNYVDCRPIFVQKALEDADFQTLDVTDVFMWGLRGEIVVAKKVSVVDSVERKMRLIDGYSTPLSEALSGNKVSRNKIKRSSAKGKASSAHLEQKSIREKISDWLELKEYDRITDFLKGLDPVKQAQQLVAAVDTVIVLSVDRSYDCHVNHPMSGTILKACEEKPALMKVCASRIALFLKQKETDGDVKNVIAEVINRLNYLSWRKNYRLHFAQLLSQELEPSQLLKSLQSCFFIYRELRVDDPMWSESLTGEDVVVSEEMGLNMLGYDRNWYYLEHKDRLAGIVLAAYSSGIGAFYLYIRIFGEKEVKHGIGTEIIRWAAKKIIDTRGRGTIALFYPVDRPYIKLLVSCKEQQGILSKVEAIGSSASQVDSIPRGDSNWEEISTAKEAMTILKQNENLFIRGYVERQASAVNRVETPAGPENALHHKHITTVAINTAA